MYLDNIELREVAENIFLVEGSWETPASCDETPAGDAAPQYMLGCRALLRQGQDPHAPQVVRKAFAVRRRRL